MGKNILKKVKISIIAIITGLSCMMVPDTFDVQAAVEGGTDIWLKLEKKTIDIDDIPDNGLIELDLYIENNTKIDGISFYTEIDDRLKYNGYNVFDGTEGVVTCSNHGLWDEPQRKLYTEVFFIDDMYEYSGVLGQLKVRLPEKEKIKVGDTYQINFIDWNGHKEMRIGILEPEVKILKGAKYFGGFEGGEIVITGDNPELVQNNPEPSNNHEEQSTPPEQQNNEQSQSENSNENNTAQPQTESVTTPVTTVSQVTTSITTAITTVKETKATTVSTVPATVVEETESITETESTDAVINKAKEESNNNSKNKIKIIIFVAAIVVLASVSAVAIRNKKR